MTDSGLHAGHELDLWQVAILLGVFAGLIVWNRAGTLRVRRVSSVLALGVALCGAVAWWWTRIDGLLAGASMDSGNVSVGADTVVVALVFGAQIVVGLAMFTAAFPGSAGET